MKQNLNDINNKIELNQILSFYKTKLLTGSLKEKDYIIVKALIEKRKKQISILEKIKDFINQIESFKFEINLNILEDINFITEKRKKLEAKFKRFEKAGHFIDFKEKKKIIEKNINWLKNWEELIINEY